MSEIRTQYKFDDTIKIGDIVVVWNSRNYWEVVSVDARPNQSPAFNLEAVLDPEGNVFSGTIKLRADAVTVSKVTREKLMARFNRFKSIHERVLTIIPT